MLGQVEMDFSSLRLYRYHRLITTYFLQYISRGRVLHVCIIAAFGIGFTSLSTDAVPTLNTPPYFL